MIKREIIILYILIVGVFLLCGTVFVSAEDNEKYGIYVNSTKLDQSIYVHRFESFDYVPLNKIKTNLDITVKEDKSSNIIYIITSTKTIKIVNKNSVEMNGSTKLQLDIPIKQQDGNIYFPVLYLVDLLDYKVEIMDDIKCIRIKTPSDKSLVGTLVDAELKKTMPVSKVEISNYPKIAYLTFDDGLDSKVTPIILDVLKQYEVKATFFIVGNTIEKNTSLLKRMIDEGHIVGNHTYTHKKENIYNSADGLKAEIEKTNAALYKADGIITKLFRPPYGGTYIRKAEQKVVLAPYKTILWNVDSRDSSARNVSSLEIYNNVVNQVKSKRSAVIIMHDSGTHMETAKALPDIIKYLKDNGFTIEPITESTNIYYQY